MPEFRQGERVLVNVSAGIAPGVAGEPEWEPGTIEERMENGFYLVRLDGEIAGRGAEKEAAPEHIRPMQG